MKKEILTQQSDDYQRIERAIAYLEKNFLTQPSLEEIACSVNVSMYHFHRLFKRWAGISPNQFLQFLTLEYTKKKLVESRSLLDASFDAGLSGPSRLHDLFVTFEAITPGEYKKMGADLKIEFGFHSTPFGECLLAITDRGICSLSFVENHGRENAFEQLKFNWAQANFIQNNPKTQPIVNRIFSATNNHAARPFHLLLKGTNFQVQVWQALLTLPQGTIHSYRDIAALIGKPTASRAVGNAVAVNPIGYLIPCHRVIRNVGEPGGYRWGAKRKKAVIAWEAAQSVS